MMKWPLAVAWRLLPRHHLGRMHYIEKPLASVAKHAHVALQEAHDSI